MKKQILIITLAVVGLTISACSNKDSYRSVKPGSASGGVSETSLSTEQKAIEMITTDSRYSSILNSEESEILKANVDGIEFQQIQSETENTTINKTQFTFLDKDSKDCNPTQVDVMAYSEQDLIAGVKLKGIGELKCIETSDCSSVLLVLEKKGEAFVDGNLRQNITQGSAPIIFMRDENGVFKPAKTESDIFADAKSIDDSIQACLSRKAKAEQNKNAYKEYADSRMTGQRIDKLTKEIASLEAQLKNNAPSVMNVNEIKAKISKLKSERAQLIGEQEELETMDPTVGQDTSSKNLYQAPRVGPQ